MSYSNSRYRPSGRQVSAPDDSRSRYPASSHHNAPSRTPQPGGGDSRARSFPADDYLGYSSDDDDDDFYRSSSGRGPGGSGSSGHRGHGPAPDQGYGRSSSRGYGGYGGYDDDDYDADSDRSYGRGGGGSQPFRASVSAPRDDRHGHGPSSSSHRDQGRDEERYYAPGGSSSSGRHHDRDYGHNLGPGPSSRHRDDNMPRGDPRAPSERGISGHESRREIPFRYMSPFDLGFGGSRERGGGGGGGGRSDPFGDDWDFPSRSGHRRSSGRDDGWFSDGESDWSDGFW